MNPTVKKLIAIESVFLFGFGLFSPIYAIFVERIGGNILDVGIAYFIFLICMATLELPMGRLADKYGRKPFLVTAYLLVASVFISYIFITKVYHLFILQFLYGVALAVGDPAWDAWFSRSLDKSKESFEWGLFHMSTGYAEAISALIGGAIAYFIGFKTLFFLSACFALISAFITWKLKDFRSGHPIKIVHRRHIRKRRFAKKVKKAS